MSVSREATTSLWMATDVAPSASRLARDEKAGTVIVGAGIAGLSVAYELTQRGQDVVVLDRGPIGKGMTSRTTAHLSPVCDDTFSALIKICGEETARACWESQSAAVDRIEAIQQQELIDCNFRRLDGVLFPALGHGAVCARCGSGRCAGTQGAGQGYARRAIQRPRRAALPALPQPGNIPSPEISPRPRPRDRGTRWSALCRHRR